MSTVPVSHDVQTAMLAALAEARAAHDADEVPVGAAIMDTRTGTILVRAQNRMRRDADPTSHAELLALRALAAEHPQVARDACTLVVTLEPCAMCAGAIVLSRVGSLVFGAWDDKAGMCGSVGDIVRHGKLNHRPAVLGGVMQEANAALLHEFFERRRRSSR